MEKLNYSDILLIKQAILDEISTLEYHIRVAEQFDMSPIYSKKLLVRYKDFLNKLKEL